MRVEQTVGIPPDSAADVPDLGHRYLQLAGGIGWRPSQWCALRAGAAMHTVAFLHPSGGINDTLLDPIFGHDNSDTTVGAFVALNIYHQF